MGRQELLPSMQRRSHRYANDRDRNNRSELGPALGHCMLQMRDIPKLYGQDGAFRGLITTSPRRHTTHRRRYINVVSSTAVTRFSSIFSLSLGFFLALSSQQQRPIPSRFRSQAILLFSSFTEACTRVSLFKQGRAREVKTKSCGPATPQNAAFK